MAELRSRRDPEAESVASASKWVRGVFDFFVGWGSDIGFGRPVSPFRPDARGSQADRISTAMKENNYW